MKHACLIMFVFASVAGCGGEGEGQADAALIHVFSDRSDATYEWVLAVRGAEVIAERHVFPGYREREIYRLDDAPLDSLAPFLRGKGNIEPPFEPPGPWFARMDINPDDGTEPGTRYFANDTAKLPQALAELQRVIVSDGQRLDALPPWIHAHEQIAARFGHAWQ